MRAERAVPRPRGRLGQLAGMVGPAGATAVKVMAGDRPAQRVAAVRAFARRRARGRQRGLVVRPGGRLEWAPVPAPPAPPPRGATVHPIAASTCDMDRPVMLARTPFPLPLHLGHECVAEVVEVGCEVQDISVGQRVVVPFQINCGRCQPCRLGRTGNCVGVPALSMYGFGLAGGLWGGVLADLLSVPFADAMLVSLPADVQAASAASVGDNVSDGYRHVAPHMQTLLKNDPSARVLIVSGLRLPLAFTASMPLYAGMIALALGARSVEFVDAREHVRELAQRLGMHALAPEELHQLEPALLVVDATATPRGLHECLRLTAADGICSSAGSLHSSMRFPLLASFIKNVTLHIGRSHARALMPDVLALIAEGRIRPQEVTTQVAPLDDAPSALRAHCADGAVKTVLTAA